MRPAETGTKFGSVRRDAKGAKKKAAKSRGLGGAGRRLDCDLPLGRTVPKLGVNPELGLNAKNPIASGLLVAVKPAVDEGRRRAELLGRLPLRQLESTEHSPELAHSLGGMIPDLSSANFHDSKLLPTGSTVKRKNLQMVELPLPSGSMKAEKKEPTELGLRIESARKAAGITSQNKLEKKAELGVGYVSRLISGDRGGRMTEDVARRLAGVLGVRSEWLATGKGPRTEAGASGRTETPPGEMSLAEVVATYPGRWSTKVVAAAAGAYAGGAPDKGWIALLDDLQKVLEG